MWSFKASPPEPDGEKRTVADRVLAALKHFDAARRTQPKPLTCVRCHAPLIDATAIRRVAQRLPRLPFWRNDTRRTLVRCDGCQHIHFVFTYPLYNWIHPRRLITEMTTLSALSALLCVCEMLPRGALMVLLRS